MQNVKCNSNQYKIRNSQSQSIQFQDSLVSVFFFFFHFQKTFCRKKKLSFAVHYVNRKDSGVLYAVHSVNRKKRGVMRLRFT